MRIVMTVVFIYVFSINMIAATVLFVLASVTDFFDGYLARKYHLITSFGKIMDPIADKFLILSAFAMFAFEGMFLWWMFWVIAVREISVTLFRFWAMSKGKVLAAEKSGKLKTVLQMGAIGLLFISAIIFPSYFYNKGSYESAPIYISVLIFIDVVVVLLAISVTVLSGILVFWNNRRLFCQDNG